MATKEITEPTAPAGIVQWTIPIASLVPPPGYGPSRGISPLIDRFYIPLSPPETISEPHLGATGTLLAENGESP